MSAPVIDIEHMDGYIVEWFSDGTARITLETYALRCDLLDALAHVAYGVYLRDSEPDILPLLDEIVDAMSESQALDIFTYIARMHDIEVVRADG